MAIHPPHLRPSLLIAILSIATLFALSHDALARRTIILDPGHGSHDKGGTHGYVYEKHLALDTARRVERLLREKGYRVILVRSRDNFETLQRRSDMGNNHNNALFISIHYNWASREGAAGIETFYHHRSSYDLARYVQAYMLRATGATNRGVKHGNFHVIRRVTRNPAILIEAGFVSNAAERRRLQDGAYRERIAVGIASGIIAYDSLN
jgi:N-acetylmuramoyl-L-alanine amidase